MIALLKPFTNAEPGSFGELIEVLVFVYCLLSLMAPVIWRCWHRGDDPNRLRRYFVFISMPLVWPFVAIARAAQILARYLGSDFVRECRDLLPKRKMSPPLRSPRELGLYE